MSDDLISRQAAIDALMPIYKSASLRNRNVFSTTKKCMATIEELPSAQPERKKGKWIGRGDDAFECSECHAVIEGDEVYWRNNYFCYHCGAKMERKEE